MSAQKTAEQVLHDNGIILETFIGSSDYDAVVKAMELYAKQCTSDLRGEVERAEKKYNDLGIKFDKELERWQERDMNELNKRKNLEGLLDDMAGALMEYRSAEKELTDFLFKFPFESWRNSKESDDLHRKLVTRVVLSGGKSDEVLHRHEETKNK